MDVGASGLLPSMQGVQGAANAQCELLDRTQTTLEMVGHSVRTTLRPRHSWGRLAGGIASSEVIGMALDVAWLSVTSKATGGLIVVATVWLIEA